MNLNKVFLIGNITRDPEMKTLPSGTAVTTFGLATNRTWNKDGQKQTQAEFHNIVAFGRTAEVITQYLNKGSMILVEGRIQTRTWDGQDGQKKSRTEVIVEQMQMGPRSGGAAPAQAGPKAPAAQAPTAAKNEVETIQYPQDEGEINPDEIPF